MGEGITIPAPWRGTRSVRIHEFNAALLPGSCSVCQRLRREEAEAEARHDSSRAADCRVPVRRHPHREEGR
ncbi:hypothetical protein GA0115252_149510 [Streptomyces sp. DfronAA-171]|nr:hypothetical protein GA0115252_149510 [Streptomyces sp. DfronAA-171]